MRRLKKFFKRFYGQVLNSNNKTFDRVFRFASLLAFVVLASIAQTGPENAMQSSENVYICQDHGPDPHGGNPHGGNPHWEPAPDKDLPANKYEDDPYYGRWPDKFKEKDKA